MRQPFLVLFTFCVLWVPATAGHTNPPEAVPTVSADPDSAPHLDQADQLDKATVQKLDLGAVAARARQVSVGALRAQSSIELARADRTRNIQRLNPRVGLSARYTRISEEDPIVIDPGIPGVNVSIPPVKPDQWAFGVSVVFPLSDWLIRKASIEGAGQADIAARRALGEAAERRAGLDAALAYLSLVRLSRLEGVARLSLGDAERRAGEVKRRIDARVASPADHLLAEVDIAARRQELDEIAHKKRLVLTQLSVLLQTEVDESSFALDVGPFDPSTWFATPSKDLLAEAWKLRPEPRALEAGEKALAARLDLARAQRLPRLDLAANAQLVDPNPRTLSQGDGLVGIWDVSAVVSWQLDGLWQATTDERGLAAERASLAADRRQLDDGLRLELESALTALRDAQSRTAAAATMVRAATEGYRVRSALYVAMSATATEVAEAETQLARARLALVDAETSLWVGKALLDHATGRPF